MLKESICLKDERKGTLGSPGALQQALGSFRQGLVWRTVSKRASGVAPGLRVSGAGQSARGSIGPGARWTWSRRWGKRTGKCEKMDQRRGHGSKGHMHPPRARRAKPLRSLLQLGVPAIGSHVPPGMVQFPLFLDAPWMFFPLYLD